MIGKLSGKVDSFIDDKLILDVNNVGYLVHCSVKTLNKMRVGESCELMIETHVREDHIHLYGFNNLEEKQYFNILQLVNGIGPRLAITILSHLDPADIQVAVGQKNKDIFKSVSGVGVKMAERILMELKDKVGDTLLSHIASISPFIPESSLINDSASALINLGINKLEAFNIVSNLLEQNPDATMSQLITLALKNRTKS